MKITIIGAGAIGGSVGAYLSLAHDVLLVDTDVEHVARMNAVGLRISGIRPDRTFQVRACTPAELVEPLGFVILAVKAQATEAALRVAAPLLAPDGFIVSMQNGLTEEDIARVVGSDRTIGCLVHFAADYLEPGHIQLASQYVVYLGELGGVISPRVKMVADVIGAAMPAIVTDNIWGWKWSKMCFLSLYFAGALLDVPMFEALTRREYRPTFSAMVTECVTVAHALGHGSLETYGRFEPRAFARGHTPEADAALDAMAVRDDSSLKIFSGMQRDIMVRKRPTEVDEIIGVVVRKARDLGIDVPLHREVLRQMKEIERGERRLGWHNLAELAAARPGAGEVR